MSQKGCLSWVWWLTPVIPAPGRNSDGVRGPAQQTPSRRVQSPLYVRDWLALARPTQGVLLAQCVEFFSAFLIPSRRMAHSPWPGPGETAVPRPVWKAGS
jgi:hypothetical protein